MTELSSYTAEELATYPAPELFHLLVRNEDRVPRNLIDECARRGDEMLDVLEPIVGKEYYWSGDDVTEGEWWLRFHAVMILGLMEGARAGALLFVFMQRLEESADGDLQEWLSGYWPALFRNKPEAAVVRLRELAEDRSRDPYMRTSAAEAVVAYAMWGGADALDAALSWAASVAFAPDENEAVSDILGYMLLDFARPEYRKKLEHVADRQSASDEPYFTRKEITQVYFSRGRTPEWEHEAFKNPWTFYDPESIAARQRRWDEEALVETESYEEETYVREGPKIGRNDPCPCGSGKKFKKCCGA